MVATTESFIKVRLCVVKNGKVLLVRNHGDKHFQIPGGKIEPNEHDIDALTHEVEEELTVTLVPKSAVHLATFDAQAAGYTNVLSSSNCTTERSRAFQRPATKSPNWSGNPQRHRLRHVQMLCFCIYCLI